MALILIWIIYRIVIYWMKYTIFIAFIKCDVLYSLGILWEESVLSEREREKKKERTGMYVCIS